MDGIPALEFCVLVIEILHSSLHHTRSTERLVAKQTQWETRPNGSTSEDFGSTEVDHVIRNAKYFRRNALLYIFEDNGAVIKIIIKGRSPTMRRISRTHKVALDWLFDRINLDPKVQIKYVDARNQPADILTKGTFTRDEWHRLLRLFSIMNYTWFFRSHLSNRIDESLVMSKQQMQEKQHGEEDARVVAKSRPTRNLVALPPNRSSQLLSSSSTLQGPGNTRASCSSSVPRSTERSDAKDSSASNAPPSQVWQADPDTDISTRRPVAGPNERAADKDLACHNLSVSSENWTCVERVLRIVRQKIGQPE